MQLIDKINEKRKYNIQFNQNKNSLTAKQNIISLKQNENFLYLDSDFSTITVLLMNSLLNFMFFI